MIKINLAAKKGSSVSAKNASGIDAKDLLGKLDQLKNLSPEHKAMAIAGGLYLLILVGLNFYLGNYKETYAERLAAELAELQGKVKTLDSELAKTTGYEKLKSDLENDEKLMKLKIETIQKLVDERSIPPQILISFSKVTPKNAWVTGFSLEGNDRIKIDGFSYGLSVISDYITALEDTIYFKEVALKSSKQSMVQDKELATFSLEARRR